MNRLIALIYVLSSVALLGVRASDVPPEADRSVKTVDPAPYQGTNNGSSHEAAAHSPSPAGAVEPHNDNVLNPHWNSQGCNACHKENGQPYIRPDPLQIDAICLKCHDGKQAAAESHPIGRTFAPNTPKGLRNTEDWPTPEGRLSCITCHNMLPGCSVKSDRVSRPIHFLRVVNEDRNTFCATCHIPSNYARTNPHKMLSPDSGQWNEQSCLFCHEQDNFEQNILQEEKTINRTADRRGAPGLVADEITLCGGCHTNHTDFFTPGHIGIRVPERFLKTMRANTASGMTNDITADMGTGDQKRSTHSIQPQRLPLTKDGRISCSTCHNPHPTGVFPQNSVLSLGSPPGFGQGDPALRISGIELCVTCHGK